MIEQFSSMERNEFHVPYLSDKIPEAVFHGQAVKTVAYLRVSTAQDAGNFVLCIAALRAMLISAYRTVAKH